MPQQRQLQYGTFLVFLLSVRQMKPTPRGKKRLEFRRVFSDYRHAPYLSEKCQPCQIFAKPALCSGGSWRRLFGGGRHFAGGQRVKGNPTGRDFGADDVVWTGLQWGRGGSSHSSRTCPRVAVRAQRRVVQRSCGGAFCVMQPSRVASPTVSTNKRRTLAIPVQSLVSQASD